MKKYYVYDHISPSGKHYIGITCQRLSQRWGKGGKNYLKKLKNGNYRHPAFAAAIEKYGWDAFEHSILFHNCSEELAKKLEVAFIAYYTERRLSYNCTDGGDTGMRPKKTPEEKKAREKAYKSTEEYKAKARERARLYHKEHRDEVNAKQRAKLATNKAHREKCNALSRKYYQEHKEELLEKGRQYYQEHKEEQNAKSKQYAAEHQEELKAYWKEYYAAHQEEEKAASKLYRQKHLEECRERDRKYYAEHKEEINQKRRKSSTN